MGEWVGGWVEQRRRGRTEKVSNCYMHSWMDERYPVRKKKRENNWMLLSGGTLIILTSFFFPFYIYLFGLCRGRQNACESVRVCVLCVYESVHVLCVWESVRKCVFYVCECSWVCVNVYVHTSVCAHKQQAKCSFSEKANKAEVCKLRLLVHSRLSRPKIIT